MFQLYCLFRDVLMALVTVRKYCAVCLKDLLLLKGLGHDKLEGHYFVFVQCVSAHIWKQYFLCVWSFHSTKRQFRRLWIQEKIQFHLSQPSCKGSFYSWPDPFKGFIIPGNRKIPLGDAVRLILHHMFYMCLLAMIQVEPNFLCIISKQCFLAKAIRLYDYSQSPETGTDVKECPEFWK